MKVEKSDNFDDFMTFEKAAGWIALAGQDGVYYREVPATTADTNFSVLKDNTVTVLDAVTKTMLEGAKTNAPTLTFTAYAVQKAGFKDAAAAWAEASK